MKKNRSSISVICFFSLFGALLHGQAGRAEESPLDSKLLELEQSVDEVMAREIRFEEKRYFPFRKKPIELKGVLRLWNGVGVSIFYPDKSTLVIADETGVLMRKFSKDGSSLQKDAGIGETDTISLLRAAFEFDRVELERLFKLDWRESGDEWAIVMAPRDEKSQKIASVTLSGLSARVGKIVLEFAGKRSIEISPLSERQEDAFSAEEQVKYFRTPANDQ